MMDKTGAIAGLLDSAAASGTKGPTAIKKPMEADKGSFGDVIGQVLDTANEAAAKSVDLGRRLQMDDPTVSLEESVIASNISSLQFTALVQTRNKVMQAYTDIMNMPV